MILADKIIHHRKLLALTQEELAAQLRVSRQAVSKWEGALSVPDMERIIQLARFFGVTIDYLLKDEMQSPEHSTADPESAPGDKRTGVTREPSPRHLSGTFFVTGVPFPLCA